MVRVLNSGYVPFYLQTPMEWFKNLTITGPDDELIALVNQLLEQLPSAGWHCGPVADVRASSTVDVWKFIPPANENVELFLCHQAGRLYVPRITPANGSLSRNAYNQILDKFVEEVRKFMPNSQNDLILTLTNDNANITEHISPEAAHLLDNFSSCANRSNGSQHAYDFERWAKFLIKVHRERNASLDVDFLLNWLVEELGWSDEQAHELISQYEFARDLLKMYDQGTL